METEGSRFLTSTLFFARSGKSWCCFAARNLRKETSVCISTFASNASVPASEKPARRQRKCQKAKFIFAWLWQFRAQIAPWKSKVFRRRAVQKVTDTFLQDWQNFFSVDSFRSIRHHFVLFPSLIGNFIWRLFKPQNDPQQNKYEQKFPKINNNNNNIVMSLSITSYIFEMFDPIPGGKRGTNSYIFETRRQCAYLKVAPQRQQHLDRSLLWHCLHFTFVSSSSSPCFLPFVVE